MESENKQYLGDGLYVEFDGHHFRLYTLEGHDVFLEPNVLEALIRFTKKFEVP